jgi:integrase-like protein
VAAHSSDHRIGSGLRPSDRWPAARGTSWPTLINSGCRHIMRRSVPQAPSAASTRPPRRTAGPGGAAEEETQVDDPPGHGPVAGTGPGQAGFPASKINQKWFGDGTKIPTDEGKLYLASVLDMGSRRVLGFALSEHHNAQLAYGALAMAAAVRGGQAPGVILHTDQGSGRVPDGLPAAGRLAVDGPARGLPWATPSSSPGTQPWNGSYGASNASPAKPRQGPRPQPGSRTTTPPAGTHRWVCAAPCLRAGRGGWRGDGLTMSLASPAPKDAPVPGPVQVIPPRA